MKILLDENLPRKLKTDFGEEFLVSTVKEMGWLGKNNGELLGLIAYNGFDIFITIDKNLQYQQNLDKFNIRFFVFDTVDNRRDTLQKLVNKVIGKIRNGDIEKVTIIS